MVIYLLIHRISRGIVAQQLYMGYFLSFSCKVMWLDRRDFSQCIIPYINTRNLHDNVTFLELQDASNIDDNYLLGILLLYLKSFDSYGLVVFIFVKYCLFNSIKNPSCYDFLYKRLFQNCTLVCDPSYCKLAFYSYIFNFYCMVIHF